MQNQKGVSLIITFLIMTVIIAIVLGIGLILFNKVKLIGNIGNSVVSFSAAESGVEKTLYYAKQPGGFCNLCNACPTDLSDPSGDPASHCNDCVATPLATDGCNIFSCVNCNISYTSDFNGRTYTVNTKVAPDSTGTPQDDLLQSVTYGNGLFVAVANTGTGTRVLISNNGISWTPRLSASDNSWQDITYGNDLFVAVASSGSGDRVMISPDGANWVSQSAPDYLWSSITYANDLFVAVAVDGNVMTSPDGMSWTLQSGFSSGWDGVAYGNGLFVAVAAYSQSAANYGKVMTSPDGVIWTMYSPPGMNNIDWYDIAFGNGLFVAVGHDGVMTSVDGATWDYNGVFPGYIWESVTYANGVFVAVGGSGVMTSSNGIDWTLRTVPSTYWRDVAYGNGLFVAVSNNSGVNWFSRVMTSPDDGITWTSQTTNNSSSIYTINVKGVYGSILRKIGVTGDITSDTAQHKMCLSGGCTSVSGSGMDECGGPPEAFCFPGWPQHGECSSGSCIMVDGAGFGQCSVDNDCN